MLAGGSFSTCSHPFRHFPGSPERHPSYLLALQTGSALTKPPKQPRPPTTSPRCDVPWEMDALLQKMMGWMFPLQLYKSKNPRSSEILINTLHRACYLSSFSLRNGRWCFCSFWVWKSIICELISVELHSTARNAKIRRLSPTIEMQKQIIRSHACKLGLQVPSNLV